METIRHPSKAPETGQRHVQAPETGQRGRYTTLVVIAVAVVVVFAVVLGGWLIGSSDDSSGDVTEVVTAEITDRQQEMLQIIEELDAALQAGTADAALVDRLFVPQGVYSVTDTDYRADDGSLAQLFELGSDRSQALYPPALVADDVVVRLGDYGGSYSHTFMFTSSEEVLIIWAHIQN